MKKLLVTMASLMIAAACGKGAQAPSKKAAEQERETTVHATTSEFKLQADRTAIPAGEVTFVVRNDGKLTHELVALKTDAAEDALEVQGSKVNEDAYQSPGEVDDVASGSSKEGTLHLTPGRYVLICNVPGHYKAGMRLAINVS